MNHILALVAWILLVIGGAQASVAQEEQSKYKIGPGDSLQIEVLEDPTFNRGVLVGPDGRITIPLAGTFKVSGMSLEEATAVIVTRLAQNFALEPTIVLSLQAVRKDDEELGGGGTIAIYVIGEVGQQGRINLPEDVTLLQAIASISGFSRFAAKNRIQLRRVDKKGEETISTFDYDDIVGGTSDFGLTKLRNGDVLLVPQRNLLEM